MRKRVKKVTSLTRLVWDNFIHDRRQQVTAMTTTSDRYDPAEHRATGKDVKSGWILVALVNIGLVVLTL